MENLTPIKLVIVTFISSLFAISMAAASPPILTGGPDDEDHEHQQLDPAGDPVTGLQRRQGFDPQRVRSEDSGQYSRVH